MGRKSSISRLEPQARQYLEQLIRQGRHTLDELLADVRAKFPQADVSRSAIHRFSVPFQEMLERMHQQQASAAVRELGEAGRQGRCIDGAGHHHADHAGLGHAGRGR